MEATVKKGNIVNGKPLKIVATRAWHEMYGGLEAAMYISESVQIFRKHPVDMLVFEMPDENHYQIRLAGYDYNTEKLDETTVVFKVESLKIKPFWVKMDDHGDFYLATFLFPEEY